jgi:diguanylate cyclase (GGDEF)-like protein/PAS domain S-box-containing protein
MTVPKDADSNRVSARADRGIARLALIGVVLAVVVVGLLVPISVRTVRMILQEEQNVVEGHQAMRRFVELKLGRSEAHIYFGAFVHSGSENMAARFERMMAVTDATLAQLRNGTARARVPEELESLFAADAALMRREMDLRRATGEDAVQRHVEPGEGEKLHERIADLLERFEANQLSHIQDLQTQRDTSVAHAWKSALCLTLVLIGGLAGLYWLTRRSDFQGRQALAALRDGEARFRSLTELSADWFWEQDEQLRFTFHSDDANANANFGSSSRGLTRRESPGMDLASADWDAHEKTCKERLPFRNFTYRRVDENGESRWIRVSGEPVFDGNGVFKGYRGVGAEVTQERRADQEIVRLKDLYAALSQTNRAIIHIHEPVPLFDEVCRAAVEHGHFCLAWIGLVDEQGWIVPQAIHGPVSDVYQRMRVSINPDLPEGRGFAAAAMREGRYYIVNDFLAEPRVAPWKEQARVAGVKALATFPLRSDGKCVGVLNLHGDEIGFFTDELVELLSEMTENISFALTNMQREAERESAKRALAASEQKFRQLAANIPEVFWTTDPNLGRITYVSPAYEKIFGRSAALLLENPTEWFDAIYPEDRARVVASHGRSSGGKIDEEFRIVRPDGVVRWLHNRAFPAMDDSGRTTMITGMAEDITSRKLDEQKLQHMAHYDNLTQLPNRALFHDRLQQTIVHARRENRSAAVVFVDVDHFKLVNDTMGHATGDQLLQEMARRLQSAVRPGDTVSRFGGDEFALILSDLASPGDAARVAQKLMSVLHDVFVIEGRELFVTASVGVTLFPEDSSDADTLIKNADVAMYRAKELGRNAYQFYKSEMNASAVERMSMENHLRRALERGEFLLHYQPKVDLVSGKITGLEALLRWQHAELGLVQPVRFIPILEDNGLIVQVGEWVIEEVARQLKAWSADGSVPIVPIAVNLSGRQLQDKDIGRSITQIISRSGMSARLFELEITESVLMRNAEQIGGILGDLRRFGVRISVDDFGTGYSSLGYLKSFPLDTLKIDRSFVRDIVTSPDDLMITRAVISMAHSLRLNVIAEGVETAAQVAILSKAGCDEMQGYYFSRPLAHDDCAQRLRSHRAAQAAPAGAGGERTLLVVDDDSANLGLIGRLLRHEGLRILTAGSAEEALEMLAVNDVGVVLSDHRMPGMTGVELLGRLKGLYPDIVRIIMSGEMDVGTATAAINQGTVFKVLLKSPDYQYLNSSVKEAFAYRTLQEDNRRLTNRVRALEDASGESAARVSRVREPE